MQTIHHHTLALDLELLLQPKPRSLYSLINLLHLLTHTLSCWLGTAGFTTNNLRDDVGPLLGLDGSDVWLHHVSACLFTQWQENLQFQHKQHE